MGKFYDKSLEDNVYKHIKALNRINSLLLSDFSLSTHLHKNFIINTHWAIYCWIL